MEIGGMSVEVVRVDLCIRGGVLFTPRVVT
jgi:hypothetical protein